MADHGPSPNSAHYFMHHVGVSPLHLVFECTIKTFSGQEISQKPLQKNTNAH